MFRTRLLPSHRVHRNPTQISTEEQQPSINVVKALVDGLLRILNDVLDVPKSEAGQFDLESIAFQLHDMRSEVTRVFGPQAAGLSS
ncbi:MAG: hypothetical protein HN396_09385 [Gemmatimonadales bacterium]|nr:hypothetical protein [Gemmatimonadales bacterium]MDG2238765.1 hypothetical protein [Longimicrobiales bacterium]MBT3497791.1 hypothetical protein [Gemmatimonadales bacterium]MBT3773065.1 hypothetical protein [Gemmatimonadales bacterium]MBT3958112.1 hypothetical protein [Gemmatimonadales bacterium]